ncbi:MAG: hypothetical protein PHR92_02315, partial [Lachnospiraceae bacterium]|nr:hypothetical protein [Lachnospiraceae bacterium]
NRTGRKGKISVGQGKIRIENLNKTFVTRRQTIQAVKDVNMSMRAWDRLLWLPEQDASAWLHCFH